MKHRNNSCYDLSKQPKDVFKKKHRVGMSIMVPFLQMFDTFQAMDKVLNVANKNSDSFWSLEEHYNPMHTLFLLCQIKDENHKDILFNVIYSTASKRVGDKDFEARAKEILALMKLTLTRLSKSGVKVVD